MVIEEIRCYYSGGENIVKHEIAPKGKQIYRGKGYGKWRREQSNPNDCLKEREKEIV